MSEATVADELAFEELPEEVKALARRVLFVNVPDEDDIEDRISDAHSESYNEGYEDGYAEGKDSVDLEEEYQRGYEDGLKEGREEKNV